MNHKEFFSNFFVAWDPATKRNYRGNIKDEPGDLPRILRGESNADRLSIQYAEGKNEPGNLFWNSVGEPFCINKPLLDLLSQNQLKGWSTIPANVTNKLGNITVDEYFALIVKGRIDPIDYLKTEIIFKEMPGGNIPHFKGLYFEPDSWDGSDICMCRPGNDGRFTTSIYVTQRFVDDFKANKVSNIEFINFNDWETYCPIISIGATDDMKKQIEKKIKVAKGDLEGSSIKKLFKGLFGKN